MPKSHRPPSTFRARVEYAANSILNQDTRSREFDSCFEMYDGDVVVAAIVRKSETDPALRLAIALWQSHGKSDQLPPDWIEAAAKYQSSIDLPKTARSIRRQRRNQPTQLPPPTDELCKGLQRLTTEISKARYYIHLETETTSSGFHAKSSTRRGAEAEADAHLKQFPSWDRATVRDTRA